MNGENDDDEEEEEEEEVDDDEFVSKVEQINVNPEDDINLSSCATTVTCTVTCTHPNCIQDKNILVCVDCGKCVQKLFNQHREWKSQQTRPNTDEKNIFKDVENIHFSEHIVQIANALYTQVTKEKIYRGNARKGIIAACVFYSFKVIGKPLIYKKIIKLFNINKKIGLKGLKFVSINAPKNSIIFKTQITPLTYIEYYMDELQASSHDIEKIKDLYYKIERCQVQKLNRSRPQSVASGIVYYWLLEEDKKITLKTFSKITELSELTIVKIQKDIKEIMMNLK
jgi:transcription initiation factor TFIIIB Brf1 subunit/transcription initiation factor TFIIB